MRIATLVASELATSGSVIAKPERMSPSSSGPSHRCFCSSLPNWCSTSMLPVSGAEQLQASGPIIVRPRISASGAYSSVRQARPVLGVGQEQVPEAAPARLLLELLHDRRVHVRGVGRAHVVDVGLLGGVDVLVHEGEQPLLEVLDALAGLEVHAPSPGPGTPRNRNGAGSRFGWMNQHSPLPSPANTRTTVSATASALSSVKPACARPVLIGSTSGVSAKPGQTALKRMPSPASAGPERAREPDDGVLVGGVDRLGRHADEPGQRRGRDDRPAAARSQRRQRRVRAEDDAVEVDAHRAPVLVELEVVAEAAAAGDAGVEEDEVEAAAALGRERDGGVVGLEVRDVGLQRVAADERRHLLGGRERHVGDHQLRAGLRQRQRGRAADAAGAAGDERDLVAQAGEVGGVAKTVDTAAGSESRSRAGRAAGRA